MKVRKRLLEKFHAKFHDFQDIPASSSSNNGTARNLLLNRFPPVATLELIESYFWSAYFCSNTIHLIEIHGFDWLTFPLIIVNFKSYLQLE